MDAATWKRIALWSIALNVSLILAVAAWTLDRLIERQDRLFDRQWELSRELYAVPGIDHGAAQDPN